MLEFLKAIPLFSQLPEEDLEQLSSIVREAQVGAGEALFHEGDAGDSAYVIEEGEIEIIKEGQSGEVLLAVVGPGEVIGEMALLDEAPRMAGARARKSAKLLMIGQEELDQLLSSSSSAVRAMLSTVTTRWRETEGLLLQSGKMAQLGTLTAGMAHELNNPASAVRRGAGQIREAFDDFQAAHFAINRAHPSEEQRQQMLVMDEQVRKVIAEPLEIDALSRSDREYEIEMWLEQRGVNNAWELASAVVNLGYAHNDLTELSNHIPDESVADVLAWQSASYGMYSVLEEIKQGAKHIADVVKALKTYAYQQEDAQVQIVDVHQSLEDALVILAGKLSGVEVRKEYAESLPNVQGFPGELSQAWANILSNAADAVGDEGVIAVRTHEEDACVIVEIEDNGSGIPHEIQSKIFDPFFTTKPPGQGVGLGLNITYNIIHQKHHGDISVNSEPGKTVVTVRLPTSGENQITETGLFLRPSDEKVKEVLKTAKNIAVVGISARKDRPAHSVPAFLQSKGYNIIPVNPSLENVLGQTAYPDLKSIPYPIDVVEIFRRSEAVPDIVDEAIEVGAKAVWMQEGIVNDHAAQKALSAGLEVMMDVCMRAEFLRLMIE